MRILTWSVDRILEEVEILDNNIKQFKSELYKICWYMRGGMTLEEVYSIGPEDREIINNIVKENLKTTKKTGMPFF